METELNLEAPLPCEPNVPGEVPERPEGPGTVAGAPEGQQGPVQDEPQAPLTQPAAKRFPGRRPFPTGALQLVDLPSFISQPGRKNYPLAPNRLLNGELLTGFVGRGTGTRPITKDMLYVLALPDSPPFSSNVLPLMEASPEELGIPLKHQHQYVRYDQVL